MAAKAGWPRFHSSIDRRQPDEPSRTFRCAKSAPGACSATPAWHGTSLDHAVCMLVMELHRRQGGSLSATPLKLTEQLPSTLGRCRPGSYRHLQRHQQNNGGGRAWTARPSVVPDWPTAMLRPACAGYFETSPPIVCRHATFPFGACRLPYGLNPGPIPACMYG